MKLRCLVLLAGFLPLAGCGSVVGGTPVPNEQASSVAARVNTPDGGLGDLSTVDVCSLLDTKALKDLARHRNDKLDSFDYCMLYADVDGTDVQLFVGLEGPGSDIHSYERETRDWLPSPLRVLEPHDEIDGGCQTAIAFKDAAALLSFGAMTEPDEKGEPAVDRDKLCGLVDALLKGAAAVIVENRVKHVAYPDDSLGHIDTCTLLTGEQITKDLPLIHGTAMGSPTKHRCAWGKDGELELSAGLSDWPVDPEFYVAETIAGRPSFVSTTSDPDYASCEIMTGHRESRPGLHETVSVYVEAPVGKPDPCIAARNLAAVAWVKLPPAA